MRIPDAATADALIRDNQVADWKSHLKSSDSVFVNASTWGLMLTGKVVGLSESEARSPVSAVNRLVNKMSEPVIRSHAPSDEGYGASVCSWPLYR